MIFWKTSQTIRQKEQDAQEPLENRLADLERERAFLAAILSSLVESVVAVDKNGRILFINAAAEKLFGIKSSLAKDRPLLEALRHSQLNDVFERTLAQQEPLTEEITVHSPTEHMLSVHTAPVTYGEGRTGVLAALHDITELRKLENVRREFVANVSHELKTPLTSIKGFVETLLDGAMNDPEHTRDFLGTIQDHTNNLAQLIDDVLDLSAIEAQRVTYRMEPIILKDVVSRIVKALEPMAKAKKVTLVVDLPDTLPKLRADREKFAQVIMNLVDNGIKYNKPGGRVKISATPRHQELEIIIEDTGYGIAPEDLPRVFERFYRGNKDRSHEIPGTGLGLAIVKHLIEAQKGSVSAESTLDEGSAFVLNLPIA